VLNPLVGELKGDDVNATMRMQTYIALKTNKLIGQGDVDQALWDKVGYSIDEVIRARRPRHQDVLRRPSEAVMHAIYRQNHGFSHLVVGRKHADARSTTRPRSGATSTPGDLRQARREPPRRAREGRFRRILREHQPGGSHREPPRREALRDQRHEDPRAARGRRDAAREDSCGRKPPRSSSRRTGPRRRVRRGRRGARGRAPGDCRLVDAAEEQRGPRYQAIRSA
jgi:hypothetical protein